MLEYSLLFSSEFIKNPFSKFNWRIHSHLSSHYQTHHTKSWKFIQPETTTLNEFLKRTSKKTKNKLNTYTTTITILNTSRPITLYFYFLNKP